MVLSKIRKQSKSIMMVFAVFFGFSIFYMFGSSGLDGMKDKFKGQEKPGDVRYTLEVNGEKIEAEVFNYRYLKMTEMLKMKYAEAGMPLPETYETMMAIKAQVVESIQREEMLVREAEQRKVVVSDQELNKVIEDDRNRSVGAKEKPKDAGLPSRISNMMEENKKTKQFRDGLRMQGIDFAQYRELVRRSLLSQKMGQTISQEMGMQESKRVQEKAMGVWKKLQSEEFSAVARQYSEDEITAQNGGAMGAKTRADLDPALSERAFNMKPGTFSEPVKTQEGFQIIKVISREEASGEEFNKQKDAIREQLQRERGPKAAVTQRDIERAYEKVYLLRILFKLKGEGELVEEWAKKKKSEKSFTLKVLDPELDAFMKFRDVNPAAKNAQAELDKVLEIYGQLAKRDQTNENVYMMIGSIYEQKNTTLNDELKKKKGQDDDKLDPYAAPEEEGKPLLTKKFLKEALESYLKGNSIAEQNQKPNVSAMLGIGRVSYQLSRDGGKDERKYRAQARKYYNEAIDFAYGDGMRLAMIKDALSKLKDEKGLKRVEAAIADMQAQMASPEEEIPEGAVPVQVPVKESGEASGEGAEKQPVDGEAPVEKSAPKTIEGGKPASAAPAGKEGAKPAAVPAKPVAPKQP